MYHFLQTHAVSSLPPLSRSLMVCESRTASRSRVPCLLVLSVTLLLAFLLMISRSAPAFADSPAAEKTPAQPCPVFPVPKQWENLNSAWEIIPEATCILLAPNASEQEKYAANRLRQHIVNRFKFQLPILTELPDGKTCVFLLGTQTSLQKLTGIPSFFAPESKANAFSIDFQTVDECRFAVVCGSDANGTIYGSDVLFDLLKKVPAADSSSSANAANAAGAAETESGASSLILQNVRISDYPSIPRRGRPHFVLMQNLMPGTLDAYVRARLNYLDLRDNPTYRVHTYYPDRAAPMGFMPGLPIDRVNVKKMIDESHRRGMFIYACVAAASAKKAGGIIEGFDRLDEQKLYANVNQTFEELLALGADGLWLSFDDIGKGSDPKLAIDNFLKLAKKHGLSGNQLAYTPPLGDYQNIDTPFNRETAKIPEFNGIQWYFTRVPSQKDADLCAQIGLQLKPAWWHNLIHLRGGFTNNANIAVTLRKGHIEKPAQSTVPQTPYGWHDYPADIPLPAYLELHSLAAGWGAPNYDKIRKVNQYTDNVMLFCIGGGWPEEYLAVMFGLWAWAPETHDWERMQEKVYSYVYGPELAKTAKEFDEKFVQLKSMFNCPVRIFGPNKGWPCRLKDTAQRPQANALLDELEALSGTLSAKAAEGSAIDPQRLEFIYLEPMRAAVQTARKMANLPFPEYEADVIQEQFLSLLQNGTAEELETFSQEIQRKLEKQLQQIETELQHLKGIDVYVNYWRGWTQNFPKKIRRGESVQKEFQKTLAAPLTDTFPLPTKDVPREIPKLFWNLDQAPSKGKIVSILPQEAWKLEQSIVHGPFSVGFFDLAGKQIPAIAFPRNVPGAAHTFAQFHAEFPIEDSVKAALKEVKESGEKKIFLDFFTTDTRMDEQYRGFQFAVLKINGKTVWRQDVVRNQYRKEWHSVDLTEILRSLPSDSRTLKITWCVQNESAVNSYPCISFLSDLRLRAE